MNEKYVWRCNLSDVCDDEYPGEYWESDLTFDTKYDAARDALLRWSIHREYLYVTTESGKYIGLAEGLNFHSM